VVDAETAQLVLRFVAESASEDDRHVTLGLGAIRAADDAEAAAAATGVPVLRFGPLQVLQYVRAADTETGRVGRLAGLRAWFAWCTSRGYCSTDPTAGVRA
jgi:hypothetical protein